MKSGPQALREALSEEFPDIDAVYSDRYLADVLRVPNRTFEYARDEKMRKSLQWRKDFGVDRLCSRFAYSMRCGVLKLLPVDEEQDPEDSPDVSAELLKLCKSRALTILPKRDTDGRMVLRAETQLIDWNVVGVEAALQYHVLIIETVLKLVRSPDGGRMPESMVLFVDTTGPMLATPPPMAFLKGLTSLLQRAYPDRIHRIDVGPVNFMLRGLYQMVSPLLSKNSRSKIKLTSARLPAAKFEAFTEEDDAPKERNSKAQDCRPLAETNVHEEELSSPTKDGRQSEGECSTEASDGDGESQDGKECGSRGDVEQELYTCPVDADTEPRRPTKAIQSPFLFFFQCCAQRDEPESELVVTRCS